MQRHIRRRGCRESTMVLESSDSARVSVKRFAIRDFPMGCGLSEGFAAEELENSVQIRMPGTGYDSEPEEWSMVPFDEEEELELVVKVELDNAGLVDLSKISDHKTTALANQAVKIEGKVYPPKRKFSAIRCFPPGCGTKNARVNTKVVPESSALKTDGLDHKIPSLQNTLSKKSGEATRTDKNRKNVTSTFNNNLFHLDTECLKIDEEKQCMNEMDKSIDIKLSGQHHSTKQVHEKVPTNLECPAHGVVLALMASSKYPFTKKKGPSTLKLMSDVAKSKVKEH